jgi:hypothetical protein
LDDPAWPEDLRELTRMVFCLQYVRFEPDCLLATARRWPESVPEPIPLERKPVPYLQNGVYFSAYPSGQLRLVAAIQQGRLCEYVRLDDGAASAFWHREWQDEFPDPAAADRYWRGTCEAQQYHPDGRVEDHYTWNNDPSPTLTTQSFEQWVRERLGRPAFQGPG